MNSKFTYIYHTNKPSIYVNIPYIDPMSMGYSKYNHIGDPGKQWTPNGVAFLEENISSTKNSHLLLLPCGTMAGTHQNWCVLNMIRCLFPLFSGLAIFSLSKTATSTGGSMVRWWWKGLFVLWKTYIRRAMGVFTKMVGSFARCIHPMEIIHYPKDPCMVIYLHLAKMYGECRYSKYDIHGSYGL